MKKMTGVLTTLVVLAGTVLAAGFRGDGTAVYADAKTPAWAKDTAPVWVSKLPSWSNSSPLPVGDKVFVGCEPTMLVCLRAEDGTNLWQVSLGYEETLADAEKQELMEQKRKEQAFNALRKSATDKLSDLSKQVQNGNSKEAFDLSAKMEEAAKAVEELKAKFEPTPLADKYRMPPAHGGTGYSTPSAVSDGKSVWAHGGNGVIACYAFDGARKWIRFVDKPSMGHGHASSPVLTDGKLIVAINRVHAFNAETGEPAWTADSGARFGTPAVTAIGGRPVIITANGEIIAAADGKVLASKLGGLPYNSPTVRDGVVYFASDSEVKAYKLPAEMAVPLAPVLLWKAAAPKGRSYATPVCHGGLLYVHSENGTMFILDGATGEKVKEVGLQLPGVCYSSTAVIGNALVVCSEGGAVVALEAGREAKELARFKVDGIRSSPAVSGNRVFLRTMGGVSCFGIGNE